MAKELDAEALLLVSSLLPNELNKFSFAFANKRHWRICSAPTAATLDLESSITALQLRKCTTVNIKDQHYDRKYLSHFFLYAVNLNTILVDKRQKCTYDLALFLLQSATNLNKKVTFVVPERFQQKFESLKEEEEEMNRIIIEIAGGANSVDISEIVTPEAVRILVEKEKDILKREYYLANSKNAIMKSNLGHLVAASVNRFFVSENYHVWKNDFSNNSLLKKTDLNTAEATKIMDKYGHKLVEAVVIMQDHWFLMASFSCFIHNNEQVDDCADLSKVGHQERAVALIRRKTKLGKDYFELTLRFGFVEVLATSGFFGRVDGTSFVPFLGASLQELPQNIIADVQATTSNTIFIPKNPKEHVRKNRIVNQYYKQSSTKNWGFYSKRYQDAGFSPANPLLFESPHVMKTAASLIIKSFAYKRVYRGEMKKLMPRVLAEEDSSLSFVNKLIRKYLVFLNDNQEASFSLLPPKTAKNELIEIYNGSLAGALRSYNIKTVVSATL